MSQSGRPSASADYNLRILWPLGRWVEDRHGAAALASILSGTGVTPAEIAAPKDWISADAFEGILERARALMPDDDTFMEACGYRIKEAYGPIRYVTWAASPGAVYAQMMRTYPLVSTVGKLSIVAQTRTSLHLRVEPNGRSISRLNCLVRQANCRLLPTMWGLPVAYVREDACIGHGDPTCEIHLRWYAARSVVPVFLGTVLFGAIGMLLRHFGFPSVPTPVFLATLGAALGYIFEVRRTELANQHARQEMMEALREIADDEAKSRREIVDLHQRQKEWTRLVEEQVRERTRALQRVVSGMQDIHQERASTLLGFSHDLRNPLQVIQFGAEILRLRYRTDAQVASILDDMDLAAGQMKRMLGELVEAAKSHRATIPFTPQQILVSALTERLQRRLRALVHDGDVRATVFSTREAPDTIDIDPLLFDRILDNLLGNAAKYTERGSIVVELDGTPGFLVIKVADTGRGMDPEQLAHCFTPGGSAPEFRARDSFGVGLSVVVQLLDQIGGRLEVMSQLGEGTTFWVHLPLESKSEAPSGARPSLSGEETLSRVVSIRRLSA